MLKERIRQILPHMDGQTLFNILLGTTGAAMAIGSVWGGVEWHRNRRATVHTNLNSLKLIVDRMAVSASEKEMNGPLHRALLILVDKISAELAEPTPSAKVYKALSKEFFCILEKHGQAL